MIGLENRTRPTGVPVHSRYSYVVIDVIDQVFNLAPCKVSTSQMTLRPTYPFSAPKCKKTRYGRDLIRIALPKSIRPVFLCIIISNLCLECFHCYVIIDCWLTYLVDIFWETVDTNVIKPVSINGVCIERVKTFKLMVCLSVVI